VFLIFKCGVVTWSGSLGEETCTKRVRFILQMDHPLSSAEALTGFSGESPLYVVSAGAIKWREDLALLRLYSPCPADFYNESPIGNLCGGGSYRPSVGQVQLHSIIASHADVLMGSSRNHGRNAWRTPKKRELYIRIRERVHWTSTSTSFDRARFGASISYS